MKLSRLWLREWVNYSLTEQELADQLTMAGLEIEAINPVAGQFNHVVIAQVLSTKPHPDADKLTLCEVDAKLDKPLHIVCGAANVRPGLKTALALIGAQLPDGLTIKASKLRGQPSEGMLCSPVELGLAEQSDGIIELPDDAPIGTDLREYLMLDDSVFEVNLTPNRGDCFSMLGLAREVAALNQQSLTLPKMAAINPVIDDILAIELREPERCPRYCGRVIRDINTQVTTPLWLTERLRRCGIRAIHPVVDVMNYVMLELGQPMHAFDLAKIKGDISVRCAATEEMELLDGQQVILTEKVLVIADQEKPLAMAGIMGGAQSAVQAETQDIFLESAFFSPLAIAGVARQYGLSTDSSQRYERGVDPCLPVKALERATDLIVTIVGGQAGPLVEQVAVQFLPKKNNIKFQLGKVKQLTGVSISVAIMKALLQSLDLTILEEQEDYWVVEVPSHRFDLQYDVDLVEEIIRLYGYNNLKAAPIPALIQSGRVSDYERLNAHLAHWFKNKGYRETISYSFVDPELQAILYPHCQSMQLLNPISSELSQMRVGLWPGLIASMIYNMHRQQQAIKFFEVGVVFDVMDTKIKERACIAGLLQGYHHVLNWSEKARSFDFFDLKGDLEALSVAYQLKGHLEFLAKEHDALHPGKSAVILLNKVPVGWIGALHPKIMDALDIQQEVLLFELNLDVFNSSQVARYKSISKYPSIRRDLSFLVDTQVTAAEIEFVVKQTIKEGWLQSFDIFDVYIGKGVPEGKKSIAVAVTIQDAQRTLVDAEINSTISAIIKALENEFSIILRE